MALKLITGPAVEPITLAEAKDHLRLEHGLDDTYVTGLIVAAREWAEEYTWRAFISQVWELTLDEWPEGVEISLPRGDVSAVVSVKYDDVSGAEQTLSSSNYLLDGCPPARIILKQDLSWPDLSDEALAVRIRYTAGFGAAAANVPQAIKQALLLLVSQLYEHRTPEVTTIVSPVRFAAEALLNMYRLNRIL